MSIATEIRLRIKAEGEGVLKGLSGKLQDIANGTQVSSKKFKLLSTALKDIQSATAKSTNSIKDYSAAWRLLAGSVDASSAEFKEATKEANQLDAKLKSFQGSQTAVANNFRNIATAATEATAAMAAAARVTSTGLRMDRPHLGQLSTVAAQWLHLWASEALGVLGRGFAWLAPQQRLVFLAVPKALWAPLAVALWEA
jgi:prophage DNA circulation protein